MHRLSLMLVLLFITGCGQRPQVPGTRFTSSRLSTAELAQLSPTASKSWRRGPVYRAVADRGAYEQVCLNPGPFGGFNAFFNVVVFSQAGRLVEETRVDVPEGYLPYRLMQSSVPLLVWFRDPRGARPDVFKVAMSQDDMQRFRERSIKALEKELARSTNRQVRAALEIGIEKLRRQRTPTTVEPNDVTESK